MSGFRPVPRVFFAAFLLLGLVSNYPAQAQNACRFLSGSTRVLCDRSAEAARLEKNKAAVDAKRLAPSVVRIPAETFALASILPAQAQRFTSSQDSDRYEIVKDGLFVNISGSYPQGYGPAWALNAVDAAPIVTNRYNLLNRGPQGTETLFLRLATVDGHAVLEFARRGSTPCIADLVGAPQLITSRPQQFPLTNFRTADRGQCARTPQSTPPWQGSISLSANANGDLALSLVLDLTMPSGKPWFEFTAQDLPIVNKMTPELAVATAEAKAKRDADAKAAAVVADKKAAEQNALEEERRRLDQKAEAALPQIRARAAQHYRTKLLYKGYKISEIADPALLANVSSCGADAPADFLNTFKKIVTADTAMQSAEQALGLSSFSRAEPHDKNDFFAEVYVYSKVVNETNLYVAAHIAVCDLDGANKLMTSEPGTVGSVDTSGGSEARKVRDYLNAH